MNYIQVFEKFGATANVRAGIIGGGAYASAIVTQAPRTRYLTACAVGDLSIGQARAAFLKAGADSGDIADCRNLAQAKTALSMGKFVATDNPMLLFDLDLDVVAEATGDPEAGARHALRALETGKHMVMINKETDSVLGHYFHQLFARERLVYTPVEGDQPAQLIQLVEWARLIGLEIICAGKARDGEYLYDPGAGTVTLPADGKGVPAPVTVRVAGEDAKYLGFLPPGRAEEYLGRRAEILAGLPGPGGFDYCELVNIANSIGVDFRQGGLLQCALRVNELPIAYALRANGGLVEERDTIDLFTLLRTREEASMGGGVFLVVRAKNDYSQHILLTKTLVGNYDGSAAVLVQPYHLCGVESSTSLLTAAALGIGTGSRDRSLRYDLARVARRGLPAGTVCTHDRDPNLESVIVPARRRAPDAPIPAHMLNGNRLRRDVRAGETITYAMARAPEDSLLWKLREQAEAYFLA